MSPSVILIGKLINAPKWSKCFKTMDKRLIMNSLIIDRCPKGGYVVRDCSKHVPPCIFAATRIDEALDFIKHALGQEPAAPINPPDWEEFVNGICAIKTQDRLAELMRHRSGDGTGAVATEPEKLAT